VADHLQLPAHITLPTKRSSNGYNPNPPPFNYGRHATTLRGVLEGLESSSPGIFGRTPASTDAGDGDEREIDASEIGDVVLKFTGTTPFTSDAFKTIGLVPLAVNDDKRYFALTSAEAREAFRTYVSGYLDGPEDFSAGSKNLREALKNIEGVELYGREDRLRGEDLAPTGDRTVDVDIALWPTSIAVRGAEKEGQRRVAALVDLIGQYAQETEDPRVAALATLDDPDLLQIHARLNGDTFNAIADHPYVEQIRGGLTATLTLADLAGGSPPKDVVLPEGAPIGVIDDLVDVSNPWLDGVVVEQRSFPDGFPYGTRTPHGTQVAGLAAWGDVRQLLDPTFDGQPHPLYVARIAQMNSDFQPQVVDNPAEQFGRALDWLASCDVRVVVLALADNHADDGAITSDLSAVVDQKVAEHGLVVVTSAGNLRFLDGWGADYPKYLTESSSKVAAPGTAATAVTVASVAHSGTFDRTRWPHGVAITQPGQTAPYSRTGPTRGANAHGRQKPEFAAHGGSWGMDQATGNLILDDAELAAVTLIPPMNGRLFGAATGTSLAAPRVAHELARIQTRYPDASGNLIRALGALAGDGRPSGMLADGEHLAGIYGIPVADRVLESGGNEVIFTYESEMPTNRHVVIPLPIPREFAFGASEREIRIALAFDPPVRRSRRHYIAGRMRFDFLHREDLNEIRSAYAKQLTLGEREAAGVDAIDMPEGRSLQPPKTRLFTDTLICRRYHSLSDGWNEDDEHYYLVVSHDHSPWTQSQKNSYKKQSFAVAVHLIDHGRLDLDLYAYAQAELNVQLRNRARTNDS